MCLGLKIITDFGCQFSKMDFEVKFLPYYSDLRSFEISWYLLSGLRHSAKMGNTVVVEWKILI